MAVIPVARRLLLRGGEEPLAQADHGRRHRVRLAGSDRRRHRSGHQRRRHHHPGRFCVAEEGRHEQEAQVGDAQHQADRQSAGTTVEVIELGLSKGLKFSGKGFKKCNIDDLIAQGPDACPSGSKAGLTGTATAVIEPGGAPLDFEVTPFVGGSSTFLFYLNGINGNGVQTAITGKITNKGRTLRITIPLELRQPANLDATLTSIDATFKGKSGKNAIVSSTKCKGGNHKVTGTLEFATRANGTPGPAPASLTEKVKCSK